MNLDLNAIKNELELMKCHVHNQHPTIDATDNISISNCCCEEFANELTLKTKELLQIQTQDVLKNTFKNIFKS